MTDAVHEAVARWANFYLITGTAAAALTGLQFIVQTLLASREVRAFTGENPEEGIAAFGSPTVVHFALALFFSAVMCAPWPGTGELRVTLGIFGLLALLYSGIVLRRTRRQTSYTPTAYDWFWHIMLPAAAYVGVLVGALLLGDGVTGALFAVGGATLLLILVGIHNSWDTVTYITIAAIRIEHAGGAREEVVQPAAKSHGGGGRRGRRRHRR